MELKNAIRCWADALGAEDVIVDAALLAEASAATFPTDAGVLAILKPENRDEVQECVAIANQNSVPLYSVSRGKNWGLGSRVPTATSVLLDLSGMDKIVDFNEELAYITVEPGVTFEQVCQFLKERDSKLFLSVTGGPPDGSLIGNVVERGDGTGPYGQRGDFVANFEVVLPDGRCLRTGFGRFENAAIQNVHRSGVGPAVDGLFTQSNLGIVTQLTIWLAPLPDFYQPFLCRIENQQMLARVIEVSRELLLHRVLEPNSFGVWNHYKNMATQGQYPWVEMQQKTPLDISQFGGDVWFGGGVVYGASEQLGVVSANHVREALEPHVSEFWFLDNQERETPYLGVPTSHNIRSLYWRKRSLVPELIDPERDGCGVIWVCHALPLVSDTMNALLDLIKTTVLEHKFEPNIGFNCVSGRCANLYTALVYDREVNGEDERAVQCHDRLIELLAAKGVLPYRLSNLSQKSLPKSNGAYDSFLQQLKEMLDPNDILAPGRYDFRR
ncbi:MAG: 4-cresol dehydrogenase (hydroxylating) [Pirellulaceae bacterium]|jgi:4-cresol dehydrogenase (hydroxylating)